MLSVSVYFAGSSLMMNQPADLVPLLGDEKTVYAFIALGRLRTNLEARLSRASPVWTLENTEAGDGAFSI